MQQLRIAALLFICLASESAHGRRVFKTAAPTPPPTPKKLYSYAEDVVKPQYKKVEPQVEQLKAKVKKVKESEEVDKATKVAKAVWKSPLSLAVKVPYYTVWWSPIGGLARLGYNIANFTYNSPPGQAVEKEVKKSLHELADFIGVPGNHSAAFIPGALPTQRGGARLSAAAPPSAHLHLTRSATEALQMNLDRPVRVAVIGGGPAGSCAAEVFAQAENFDCTIFERKFDNAKPCGGAIPLCMIEEFDLPPAIVDRKVRKMKMISPSNREVDVGRTLKDDEYIGMTRREVLDGFMRDRAVEKGATPINGLVTKIELPTKERDSYLIKYSNHGGGAKGEMVEEEFDIIIGADGANSRTAKAIDAGEYNYAIAFQERIKIPDDKMKYYEDLAEMYVGSDVSPDFYAWVFPKKDHVGVGTGTVVNRPAIKEYQAAIRERAKDKLGEDQKIIKVEAHPIPEHPRPRRVVGRVALVGDAAGYVTKCSGEGIYFAAKSGRMAAEEIVALCQEGTRLPEEQEIKDTYLKKFDSKYGPTYLVLDLLQKVFYTNNGAREAFVDMCASDYVQKVTFDSYLYKKVQGNNPVDDVKLLFNTFCSIINGNKIAPPDLEFSNPKESLKRL